MRKRMAVVHVDFEDALVLTKVEGAMTVKETRQINFVNLEYTKVNELDFKEKFKLMVKLIKYVWSE